MSTISPIAPHVADTNSGIVPPWLATPKAKNPGVVPPWLQTPVHTLPVGASEPIATLPVDAGQEFHILPVDGETEFVSTPACALPMTLAEAIRAR